MAMHQCISIPITIMTQYVKIVAEAIEKEAISVYASRMMCLKIKTVDTTNL